MPWQVAQTPSKVIFPRPEVPLAWAWASLSYQDWKSPLDIASTLANM
jgi:hypothetical protein